jgi:hypothetical protein
MMDKLAMTTKGVTNERAINASRKMIGIVSL